jgi:hypothetical protein
MATGFEEMSHGIVEGKLGINQKEGGAGSRLEEKQIDGVVGEGTRKMQCGVVEIAVGGDENAGGGWRGTVVRWDGIWREAEPARKKKEEH